MTWLARISLVTLALLVPAGAMAQTGRVTLEVSRHIVNVGEPVQVTVSIVVEGQQGYDRYLPPTFGPEFQVAGGGMTTQNIEIINWQVRRRESYTYNVTPLKGGALTIGPATIIVGGKRISSSRVTIQARGSSITTPTPTVEPDAGVGAPGFPVHRAGEPVFLAAVAQPRKVYLGQQVVVTWYLFTRSDVLGFQTTKQPTTDNFWSEDLRSPRRLVFEQRMLGGRMFYAAVIARKALFPQQTGKLEVGPMGARVRTLDTFASASSEQTSEAVPIEVLPLPEQGRPRGFHEVNVGELEVAASLDRSSIKAGEGVTLKLVISGRGNLRQVKPPTLDDLDGFKVYKPTVEERFTLEDSVSGEKIVSYLLMPTRAGQLRLPPIHLDYFDPIEEKYRRASTDPLSLTVTGKMPAGGAGAGESVAKNVLSRTIRPPRPAGHLRHEPRRAPAYLRTLFIVLALFPVAFVFGWSGGERLRARLRRETAGSLRRAAGRRARAQLARAQERMRPGDVAGFHAALAGSMRSVLDHRLGLSIEGLTRPELKERMERGGFPADLVQDVAQELDACDAARFAPGAVDRAGLGASLDRVRRLLDRLGRVELRGREG
jgi:hypothetical protein